MDEGGRKLEDFLFRHHAADIAAMDMFVVADHWLQAMASWSCSWDR
jgi:hypothetical protein